MTRYAVFAAAHLVLFVGLLVAAVDSTLAAPVLVVASVPFLWAWGPYHADIQLNPALDDAARQRWRMAMWFAPIAMPVYWQLHVRSGGVDA